MGNFLRRVTFVPVALLAVFGFVAAMPARVVAGASGAPDAATNTVANNDWPMFGHDALHSESSPDTKVTATSAPGLTQEWTVDVSGAGHTFIIEGSPVVAYDSTLGEPVVYVISTSGTLDAIDGTPGPSPTVIWTTHIRGSLLATPAVYDGTVYIGSGNGFIEALNATTGAVECTFDLPIVPPQTKPGRIMSSPVVGVVNSSGPMVFFGDTGTAEETNAGHEWAITGVGNTAGGCHEVWSFNNFGDRGTGDTRTGTWSQPGLVQNSQGEWVVVFGSSNPDDAIYALNARSGAKLWRFQTDILGGDEDVGAGPTLSPPGTNGVADGVVYEVGKDRILYALDLLTGKALWSYNFFTANGVATNAESVPALDDGYVLETEGGFLYALNAVTGAVKWHSTTSIGDMLGSPTLSGPDGNRVLFIGTLTGDFTAFSAKTGAVLWSTTLPTGADLTDSAISDGVVYTAGGTNLYAFTPGTSASVSGTTGNG